MVTVTGREARAKLSTATKPFIFDGDQHIYEPADFWTSRVPAKYKDLAPHVVEMPFGGEGWVWEGGRWIEPMGLEVGAGRAYTDIRNYGHSYADTRPGCYDPKERIKDMNLEGVDKAIIFPSVGNQRMRNLRDRDLLLTLIRAYNDGVMEWCEEGDSDRLIPLFLLPDVGIEDAVEEYDRCARKGFKGFVFFGWPHRGGVPDPADDQIWARCQETGMIPCLHTGGPQSPTRGGLGNNALDPANLRKPPVTAETAVLSKSVAKGYTITWLVLSGVLQRFPRLKIALVETGSGWLPFYYQQLDSAFFKNRTAEPFSQLTRPPSEYLKEQMWSTIQVDVYAIKNRYEIGVDKIMWSSDYPHSGYGSEFPNSRLFIEYQFRGVPDDELRKMLGLNLNKMLGLPAPAAG